MTVVLSVRDVAPSQLAGSIMIRIIIIITFGTNLTIDRCSLREVM